VVFPLWRGPHRKKVSVPGAGSRIARINMYFILS
jgi:hypothetical protein